MTYSWQSLDDELALWSAAGRKASFWWRDDDACMATAALDRLVGISEACSAPVALAVVPAKLDSSLRQRLADQHLISVLQHGYHHKNNAPAGVKKAEYGAHRTIDVMLCELIEGREILQAEFDDQFHAVLVPPWNRYDHSLVPALAQHGYRGISAMWARPNQPSTLSRQTGPGLLQVNTHIDPIEWRGDRGFIGVHDAMEQLVCHLRLRREYPQLGDEPTGLLSHHLDHSDEVWDFCQQFAERVTADDNCVWLGAGDIWCR